MHITVIILHIIVSIMLVLIVLLQQGKGANMGAAFGGSSSTIFGSSGPGTFLSKITTVVAMVFMLTSLYLAYFASSKGHSIVEKAPKATTQKPASQAPAPLPTQTPLPAPPAGQTK